MQIYFYLPRVNSHVSPLQLGQVWNAGSCCAPATTTNVDDVDYARSIIADLSTRNVDYDGLRVSVVGVLCTLGPCIVDLTIFFHT